MRECRTRRYKRNRLAPRGMRVTALADSYRVHYSIRGGGRDAMVQAESSAEARRVVWT